MNLFEFTNVDSFENEFIKAYRQDAIKLMTFKEYSQTKTIKGFEIECMSDYLTCREYSSCNEQWLLVCKTEKEGIGIGIYTRSDIRGIELGWIHYRDFSLTKALSTKGLTVTILEYFDFYPTNGVLIAVFQSPELLIVVRIDIDAASVTDIFTFHPQSVFHPTLPQSQMPAEFVMSPDGTLSLLLIDQTTLHQAPYLPTIAELQSVLTMRLIGGVKSLLLFWTSELTSIADMLSQTSVATLYHGVSLPHYLTFLYIHQSVLLDVLRINCHNDAALHSPSNLFVEHLTNLTNDYLNRAICIVLSWLSSSFNDTHGSELVDKTLNMLCHNSRIFRELVLDSRSTLSVYQRLSFNKHVKKSQNNVKLNQQFDSENMLQIDQSKIVSECLKTRKVAALQYYSMIYCGKLTTEEELLRQSEMVILSKVQQCDWKELLDLVANLGHEPIKALTSLCYYTKTRRIRDYLYHQLHLDRDNNEYKIAKNFVDQMEVSFTIHVMEVSDPSFRWLFNGEDKNRHYQGSHSHIQSYVDRLDKTKCRSLRQVLMKHRSETSQDETHQLININLNLFIGLLKQYQDLDSRKRISDNVEFCLVDADYRRLLMETKHGHNISQERLITWIYKWRKNTEIFARYVTESCDFDLMIAVVDIDFCSDYVVGCKIIDELSLMLLDRDDHQCTEVDRQVAKEVMLHILTRYPECLIPRLEQMYSGDLAKTTGILKQISKTFPIHMQCRNLHCPLRKTTMKDSSLLNGITELAIEEIVSNQWESEFPIVFYFLLNNSRSLTGSVNVYKHQSLRKAALLHSAVLNRTAVDNFNCLISRDVTVVNEDGLTPVELDEIVYAALLSGISYGDIMESSHPTIASIRKILDAEKYWDILKKRLLRPHDYDVRNGNVEQYYDANLYNFLQQSGTPLALNQIFAHQPHNPFSKKEKAISPSPVETVLDKSHSSLLADPPKESLNYLYYISLGRPFQALRSLENEFAIADKPGCIPKYILEDLMKSIYHIALSNIDDRVIIGGCFGLIRLIGSTAELLRCYLTLIREVINWHVLVNDHYDLSDSTQTQLPPSVIRRHYALKTMSLFKFCLSKNSTERKNSRDFIIRQLEEIFVWRMKNNEYKELSVVLSNWNLILYFCQQHNAPFSTIILQYYAKKNEWLIFLCTAQVFGYSKDQVKESLNQFEDASVRHHVSYIVSKVDELLQPMTQIQPEDFPSNSKTDLNLTIIRSKSSTSMPVSLKSNGDIKRSSTIDNTATQDFVPIKYKSHNKYPLSALMNSAKNSLLELIFDCQLEKSSRTDPVVERNEVATIQLNIRKLLANCLALGHPFISVLAYSSDVPKGDSSESSKSSRFDTYLSCLSCFIVSSSPKKMQENIWSKWGGVAKLDWSDDALIDLILFAIENHFVHVVANGFSVLKVDRLPCVSSFYSMISHAYECYNPVLRQLFLTDFVNECTKFCLGDSMFITVKDRHREKSLKNNALTFINRLLGSSLVAALEVVEKNLGPRALHEWLGSLSNSASGLLHSHVKKLFSISDTNISLLTSALSLYFDFVDLDPTLQVELQLKNQTVPVNTKSKEFIQFVENLIESILEKLQSCYDYTRSQLAKSTLALVDQINLMHSVQLPTNRDKWKSNENQLKMRFARKIDSSSFGVEALSDLVSMALAGQVDRIESVLLCQCDEQNHATNDDKESHAKMYECSYSWKRLVIPEDWQDKILDLPNLNIEDDLEKVSHVSCLLNGKKWIEACKYMIEHQFSVKDAVLILTSMKMACGKVDPAKLSSSIRSYCKFNHTETVGREQNNNLPVRRMSVIINSSISKFNVTHSADNDVNHLRSTRQSRSIDPCQQFLTKVTEVLIHGQELVEYICTIYCVSYKMAESYSSVASREEFDVLTKILVGTCRDKIDTADMYLGVVDLDSDKLCHFFAEVIVHVLRLEIQTYIGSTSIINTSSYQVSAHSSPKRPQGLAKTSHFSISPSGTGSPRSHVSSSPNAPSTKCGYTAPSHISVLSLHENTLKVAERCQLRSEWRTGATMKIQPESRLIKAFSLSEILVLSPSSRKLGKILFSYYQRFSLEIFSCNEDAEFLVHLLIQCHSCYTDGGDTIGISNCLKAAKELSKLLNSNGYFVLMAQLLCRIGRYGEMPYIFSNLIENHQFEQLLRKGMDKDGMIVPYIFDYLNRYHNDDYEKMEIVCVKYNCYYELAETKSKMAELSIVKLKAQLGPNSVKETLKSLTSSVINNLLGACTNYMKAGCYKKMEESFRKAQFYKLQQKWTEDPDKTFTMGPLNKRLSSGRVVLPETGQPYGVKIIGFNSEQAVAFLRKVPNFYTAFIVSQQLRLSLDVWLELLMHHVLINGDDAYLQHYFSYFGSVLSSNFIQQILNRLERASAKLSNKHGLNGLKLMLSHCDDVFFVRRMSESYKLVS